MTDERRPYTVHLRSLYDEDERLTIRVNAYGPNDVRGQCRESHPDFGAVSIEEARLDAEDRMEAAWKEAGYKSSFAVWQKEGR